MQTEFFKVFIGAVITAIIALAICNYIFDYFDKRRLERRTQSSLKRFETRQALSCKNCKEVQYYRTALEEINQEKVYLDKTIHSLQTENSILRDNLTKARLHNQSASEDGKVNESDE